MKYKDGQYFYSPNGNKWTVYQFHGNEHGGNGTKVGSFSTKEEARDKVYELNGWNKPTKK